MSLTAVASGGVISGLGDLPSPLDHPELVFKADGLLRLWEGEMLAPLNGRALCRLQEGGMV